MTTQFLLRLTFLLFLLSAIQPGHSQADSLRRRGYLGATIVPLPDSVILPAIIAGRGGVLITEIRPDGSAKAAGLKAGRFAPLYCPYTHYQYATVCFAYTQIQGRATVRLTITSKREAPHFGQSLSAVFHQKCILALPHCTDQSSFTHPNDD
jgi:hypothetical protein